MSGGPANLTAALRQNVDRKGSTSEPPVTTSAANTTAARLAWIASINAPLGVSVRMPAMALIDMTMPISASFQFWTVRR